MAPASAKALHQANCRADVTYGTHADCAITERARPSDCLAPNACPIALQADASEPPMEENRSGARELAAPRKSQNLHRVGQKSPHRETVKIVKARVIVFSVILS